MSSFSNFDSEAQWHQRLEQALNSLTLGKATSVELLAPDPIHSGAGADDRRKVLLPGSFNPLHEGHLGMANWVSHHLGLPVWFELSFVNADKPVAFLDEIRQRLRQQWIQPNTQNPQLKSLSMHPHGLILTGNARFLSKAREFPGSLFAVGIDTIMRVADPRFYDNQPEVRDASISEIADLGCNFLVFGRLLKQNFQTLESANLPPRILEICQSVEEATFRKDISSTQLRRAGKSQDS